jgi:glycosyltransferase involved in cell wall biosynthesis
MKKLLVITPHCSTGGAPQVTANKIELLKDDFEILLIEYSFLSNTFIVQRNRIIDLIGNDHFISLGEDKSLIVNIIQAYNPSVIAMEEFPEMFMDSEIAKLIYKKDRTYKIVETTHDSSFKVEDKVFLPDEFVFVSPYTLLKYRDFDVPTSLIEYPVDKYNRDRKESRKILGLQDDYKHVVVIGLFTPRKNQKYAFELAKSLEDYKIKFHFLGNTAENFSSYWQPLMNNKPSNCIIWGERDDTEEFIRACDLFLFPSRGDKYNKELNPIVIKEAIKFDDVPKLLFNLDVYLNRYNNEHNFNFLVDDLKEDSNIILRITNPKPKVNGEELIIIGTYPNLKSRVQLTKDTIQSLYKLERKIMLVSHYPVDLEIQKMVDYYVYDANNPLTHHSFYTKFFNYNNEYEVDININGLKNSNQSLTVLTNMYNGAKLARELGYRRFFYNTYDVVVHEDDLATINESLSYIESGKCQAYLGTLATPFGRGIQTNGMTFSVDFFLHNFDNVRDAESYNRACENIGAQNFLEDYLVKKVLSFNENDVHLIENEQDTFLTNSGVGVASNSEYYSILPIEFVNKYMFYFFTYNIDERKINVTMKENGLEFYNNSFQINKTREFKKEFYYDGKEIEIILEFYDGDDIYKVEKYLMNEKNINDYDKTGSFKHKNKMPKIKLVHIQTTLNDEKHKISKESLERVKDFGWEYVLHTNEPYSDLPPRGNCLRPACVSMFLFEENRIQEIGTALTPSHYGCYESFKNAILTEFDDEDFLIVCEGDCLIESTINEFIDIISNSLKIVTKNNIGYMSFGDTRTLEHGWLQSNVIEEIPNQDLLFITDKIIGLQCIMFPKYTKKWLFETLRTHKWDAADIYFNTIFKKSPYKMGILKHRITTQLNGYSLIDKQEKTFI